MNLSPSTATLLAELDALAHHRLRRRDDLGILLELGTSAAGTQALDELSFYGKFISRSFRIMQRIGREGQGYDKLEQEFRGACEHAKAPLEELLRRASEEVRTHFRTTYLLATPESLENFLSLCEDLSWYKNRLIDRRESRS